MTKGDEVASFLIQERGYIVVGMQSWFPELELPAYLNSLAGMELSQELVVYQKTTFNDWMKQAQCGKILFKNDPAVPRGKADSTGRYYRAMTD